MSPATEINLKHRDERAQISADVGHVCGPAALGLLLSLCAWFGIRDLRELVIYGIIFYSQLMAVICWLWALIQWPERFHSSFWLLSSWCALLLLYGLL